MCGHDAHSAIPHGVDGCFHASPPESLECPSGVTGVTAFHRCALPRGVWAGDSVQPDTCRSGCKWAVVRTYSQTSAEKILIISFGVFLWSFLEFLVATQRESSVTSKREVI